METIDSATLAAGLAEARLRMHRSLAKRTLLAAAVLATVAAGLLWQRQGPTLVLPWLAMLLAAMAGRSAVAQAQNKAADPWHTRWLLSTAPAWHCMARCGAWAAWHWP